VRDHDEEADMPRAGTPVVARAAAGRADSGLRPVGRCLVGISGWQYDSWRGDFYPTGLPVRRQLEYVAEHLPTVELNGPFYSLQRPSSYAKWHDQTPEDFLFAVKGGRFITHYKRLVGVETALANFFSSGVLRLACKLGPLLWQLPARMTFDEAVMKDFLDALPTTSSAAAALAVHHNRPEDKVDVADHGERRLRHAIEPRHSSFVDDRFFGLLEERDMCCVVSDAPSWPIIDVQTTDLVYVRLHGHSVLYASGYSRRSLDAWAERCRRWTQEGRDTLVYFDNDARGHAPHDAVALKHRLFA
jgi:uncharacterized protein YecE (DUF72 family)